MKLLPAPPSNPPPSNQSSITIFQLTNASNLIGTPNSKLISINPLASPRTGISMSLRTAPNGIPGLNTTIPTPNGIHQSNSSSSLISSSSNPTNAGVISSTTSNNSLSNELPETANVTTTNEANNENFSVDSSNVNTSTSDTNSESESNAESTSSKNSKLSRTSKVSRAQSLRLASTSFCAGVTKNKKSKNKVRRLTASMVNQSIMSNLISCKAVPKPLQTSQTANPNSPNSANKASNQQTTEPTNAAEAVWRPTTRNINKLIPANEIKIESDDFVASMKRNETSIISHKEPSINSVLKLASTVSQYQANKKTNENTENGNSNFNKSMSQDAANNTLLQSERSKRKNVLKIIENKNNQQLMNMSAVLPNSASQNGNKQKSKSDDESADSSSRNGDERSHYSIRSRTRTVNDTQLHGDSTQLSDKTDSASPTNGAQKLPIRRVQSKRSIDQNQTFRLPDKPSNSATNLNKTMPSLPRKGLNTSTDDRMLVDNETSSNEPALTDETASTTKAANTSLNNSMRDTLKKQKSGTHLPKLNGKDLENNHASVDDMKLSLFRTALKLTYLNTCSRLSDADYDFVFQSMPVYNTYNNGMASNTLGQMRPTSKSYLNKLIIDNVDVQTSNRVSTSPLYSLILQTDADFLTIQVYIQYLDHSNLSKTKQAKLNDDNNSNLLQNGFIKLINLKPLIQSNENGQLVKESGNDKSRFSRQLSGLSSETKWSKYLFEQLKNNVINLFRLNKQNLMCLSIETRILERLCFATFQLYLNDFLHTCILIIPNYIANKSVFEALTNWKYDSFSIESYFKSMISLVKYLTRINLTDLSSTSASLNDIEAFFVKNQDDYFSLNHLAQLIEIIEFVYTNYARIVSHLEQAVAKKDLDESIRNEFDLKSMQTTFDSIDYFYMTCLLGDLFRFLYDYRVNPKRFSSLNELKMPWNYNGSLLNNLLCVQLMENSTPISNKRSAATGSANSKEKQAQIVKNTTESFNTPNRLTNGLNRSNKKSIEAITAQIVASQNESNQQKSLLECDNSRLEYLNSMKKSIEKLVLDLIDFSSDSINREKYSYPTTSSSNMDDMNESSEMGFSMIEIYSALCQMFDVNFKNVKYNSSSAKYQIQQSLSEKQMQSILDYYEFRNLVSLENINFEYKTFFESFFSDMSTDSKIGFNLELSACLKEASALGKSIFLPGTKIMRNFIEFVYQSNNMKFCPVISFLATIFLCLPSITDFKEVCKLANGQTGKPAAFTTQELVSLEHKMKFLSTVDYNGKLEDCLIKFDEIPCLE